MVSPASIEATTLHCPNLLKEKTLLCLNTTAELLQSFPPLLRQSGLVGALIILLTLSTMIKPDTSCKNSKFSPKLLQGPSTYHLSPKAVAGG